MTTEKFNINWDLFDLAVKDILDEYRDQEITQIVGLSRGGLPLAVTLSNKLSIPMIPIVWQTRDGLVKDIDTLKNLKNIETTLFVDDICDSGLTIKQIREVYPDSIWCALVSKKPGFIDYSPIEVSGDEWVIFPWE